MSVEQEIVNYFNKRIEANKEQILKVFRTFLNDELYQRLVDRIDKMVPVFYVEKRRLEKCLEFGLTFEEERLLEYFGDKIDANPQSKSNGEKYVINENLEQEYKNYIYSHEGAFFGIFNKQNTLYSMVKIYDGTLMYTIDFDLIQCYLDIILRRDTDYRLPNIDLTDPFEKETYRILKEALAILIYRKLRENNTYILDNKEHSSFVNDLNIDEVDQEFFANFSDLINLFLQNPFEFIDIVGKENFDKFARLYVEYYNDEYVKNFDNDGEAKKVEIKEAIEAMTKHRASKMQLEIVYINASTIEKMLNQYRQKKENQVNSANSNSRYLEYLAFLQRCKGNRRGIYKKDINIINNIEKINNIIKNIEKEEKFHKDIYNIKPRF